MYTSYRFEGKTSRCAKNRLNLKIKIKYTSSTIFFIIAVIVRKATCFGLLIRSSSGLFTLESKGVIYVLGFQHVYTTKHFRKSRACNARELRKCFVV